MIHKSILNGIEKLEQGCIYCKIGQLFGKLMVGIMHVEIISRCYILFILWIETILLDLLSLLTLRLSYRMFDHVGNFL